MSTELLHATTSAAAHAPLRVTQERGWRVVSQPLPHRDPLRELLGKPGLWRALRDECVFELAPLVRDVSEEDDDWDGSRLDERRRGGEDVDPDRDLLDWATATAAGIPAGEVAPPTSEDLDAWVPRAARHVRAGPQVSPISLVAEPCRVALVAPALARIPPDLPPSREAWLSELCHDAQEKWRLVRFGIDDAQACVRAEVDLTGAPPKRARALFGLSLAALVEAASWVLPALALVTDPSIESRLLGRMPRRGPSRRMQSGNGHEEGNLT